MTYKIEKFRVFIWLQVELKCLNDVLLGLCFLLLLGHREFQPFFFFFFFAALERILSVRLSHEPYNTISSRDCHWCCLHHCRVCVCVCTHMYLCTQEKWWYINKTMVTFRWYNGCCVIRFTISCFLETSGTPQFEQVAYTLILFRREYVY